jgi:hypothetical protein
MAASVSHVDVVIAVMGATAALAGLVLVFLGGVVSTYQSLVGRVATQTLERFRRAGAITLVVFLLGLATLAVSAAWLVADGGATLYRVALVCFFAELAALGGLAVYATLRVLLR